MDFAWVRICTSPRIGLFSSSVLKKYVASGPQMTCAEFDAGKRVQIQLKNPRIRLPNAGTAYGVVKNGMPRRWVMRNGRRIASFMRCASSAPRTSLQSGCGSGASINPNACRTWAVLCL